MANLKVNAGCLLFGAISLLPLATHASVSPDGIWGDIAQRGEVKSYAYRSLDADIASLKALLADAPLEGSDAAGQEVFLPVPDSGYVRLAVFESPVMAPELAAKFPDIKTYKVQGLDDPRVSGRLDITPKGFHGILSLDGETIIIEPETSYQPASGERQYRSFDKAAYPTLVSEFKCEVEGHDHADYSYIQHRSVASAQAKTSGSSKTTYRLAVAATGEYSAAVSSAGADVTETQAEIVTAINRVNQVYEQEVAVKLELIANNDSLVYTDSGTDPYTNSDGAVMLGENQTNIDTVIGTANYDVGHVFSTGGGGVAQLGAVCDDTRKAQGVTGLPTPTGDPFYIDFVSHELGHQFGATHTFNADGATSGACEGNREATTSDAGGTALSDSAYEPGSGSTIMAYAGICNDQDLQSNSDPYFHARSLEMIREFVNGELPFANTDGSACGTVAATGDTPPVADAGSDFTIPANTPFVLTGGGSDADAGDAGTLTYTWEQYDLGNASTSLAEMHTDDGTRPLFRSYQGTSDPLRYFPQLSSILAGTLDAVDGERLPTTDRTMQFRLTVRSGAQGFDQDDMVVTVDGDAGPFEVTAPVNAANLMGATAATVTWNVANTTAAPVSCANVSIALSTDGGSNFGTILLASTANDGSESVTLPNVATSQGKIKVQCDGGIFFNVSPGAFNIALGAELSVAAAAATVAEGDAGTTDVIFTVTRSGDTSGTSSVDYAVTGFGLHPADATDFVGGVLPSGTVNFAAAETSQDITVTINGDVTEEFDEEFTLTLSNPVDAGIGTASDSMTITSEEPPATQLNVSSAISTTAEGDSGTTDVTVTITRSGDTSGTSSVDWVVTGSGANPMDASDFSGAILPSGTVNFAATETTQDVIVSIQGDTTEELDEEFTVTLSNAVDAAIDVGTLSITVTNDDAPASGGAGAVEGAVVIDAASSGSSSISWLYLLLILPALYRRR